MFPTKRTITWQLVNTVGARAKVNNRQTIETLIDEESLLFAKFLRNERENGLLGLIVLTEEETAEGVEVESNVPGGYCFSC